MVIQRSPQAQVNRWRRSFKSVFLMVIALFTLPVVQAADTESVRMGVFPYLSTRALLDVYEPVRLFLMEEMGRPVNLFTAPNYKAHANRTARSEFDILITPPHFARLAQREAGYLPLALYTRELHSIVVVANNSVIRSLQDLQGMRVATPSRLALVTIVGRQLFRDGGLSPDNGVVMLSGASHANAVLAVQRGEAEAAITEHSALAQMPKELRNSVRVIAQSGALPHVMYLGHQRLGQAQLERLKAALLKFPATVAGRQFLANTGSEGLRPINEVDLKGMDPYIDEFKRLLENEK